MAERYETDVKSLLLIGGVFALILVIVVIALQGAYQAQVQREVEIKYAGAPPQPLADERAAQLKRLEQRSIDPKTGRATIPIDQAMRIIVETKGVLPATRPQ